MNFVKKFFKNETVLSIAILLAIVSMFFVMPDKEYIDYIDFRTLALLFCLMAVMAGFKKLGIFNLIAAKLLGIFKSVVGIIFVLVMLCFIFSMLITNDVALITFVPLTIIILGVLDKKVKYRLIIKVVAIQTVAANLGSMLTPIGNPQNLYLFATSGMSAADFIMVMLPYSLIAFGVITLWVVAVGYKEKSIHFYNIDMSQFKVEKHEKYNLKISVLIVLFLICVMTVARMIPYLITLCIVIAVIVILDYKLLKAVDYSLLLAFVGFFIFIGNMGRIEAFHNFIENIIENREVYTSILCSQVMSNVPAALLLSGFTDNFKALIIGTNLGGLGTLIASMASLISFKYVAKEDKGLRKNYIVYFTVANIIILVIEVLAVQLIAKM